MKSLIYFIISLFLLICPVNVYAVSDPLVVPNNKFGIHLLDVSEIPKAAELVNSNHGDWGYITIPIQVTDKNLLKWQQFMDDCNKYHLIPIVRLAMYPHRAVWEKPTTMDLVDYANFLDSLSWPTGNRYVIIFNEPNRAEEWGGEISPSGYAQILSSAMEIFRKRSSDFFLLNAALDAAAPNNHILMNSYTFMEQMNFSVPGIFNNLDGWNSHSYPNPAFSATPSENRKNSIFGFLHEKDYLSKYLGVKKLPVFITETGWSQTKISAEQIGLYFEQAFKHPWEDSKIVAVTPFLLFAGTEPFAQFSFIDGNGKENNIFQKYKDFPKNSGNPVINKHLKLKEIEISGGKLPLLKTNDDKTFIDQKYQVIFWKNIFEWLLVR